MWENGHIYVECLPAIHVRMKCGRGHVVSGNIGQQMPNYVPEQTIAYIIIILTDTVILQ